MWGIRSRAWRSVCAAGLVVQLLVWVAGPTAEPAAAHPLPLPGGDAVRVEVDTSRDTGPLPPVAGVVTGSRTPDVARLAPLQPRFVRVDASIDRMYDCTTGRLDTAALAVLDEHVDRILAVGGEPFVTYDYMPECLAAPGGLRLFGPTRRPPADPALWEAAVAELTGTLVSDRVQRGAVPVRYFETWNEPDWFPFYDGTLTQFVHGIFLPEARVVVAEEARSGVDLRFGACSCFFADDRWIDTLIAAAESRGLPLDFVSWHYYANVPFLGPDGLEPFAGPEFLPIYRILGRRNPFANPSVYEQQARRYRTRYPGRELIMSEWNLSSGGFDRRNDTHEGAAFVTATLIAMARGGLDGATLFRLTDHWTHDASGRPLPILKGDWGLIDLTGTPKPTWHAAAAWGSLPDRLVETVSPDPARSGVWAIAARDPSTGRTVVLAASFSALAPHAHRLKLVLHGVDAASSDITLRRIDSNHTGADAPTTVARAAADEPGAARGHGTSTTFDLDLPRQSVLVVEVTPDHRQPAVLH
ncbi:MAG: hypothetical protein IT198_08685 [Acidimicrobiia bacterium]|nr:hypothetical protein [Acidimicrobiia bacterium]